MYTGLQVLCTLCIYIYSIYISFYIHIYIVQNINLLPAMVL